MDFFEWLKSMLNPTNIEKASKRTSSDTPSWLANLYKSPVADSLYSITGVPNSLGATPREGMLGDFNLMSGELNITPDQKSITHARPELGKITPREVLIHEMGHKQMVDKGFPNTKAYINQSYTPQLDSYYTTNNMEGYAQAFKNAFNFLQETARDPKMDVRRFAGDLEANTPGMGMIVKDLLVLPIFSNHPLRGKIFTDAGPKK